jgi:hypothetical protein
MASRHAVQNANSIYPTIFYVVEKAGLPEMCVNSIVFFTPSVNFAY